MRKALIVWGGWDGHEPDKCAAIYKNWLTEDGFNVTVAAETEAFADPELSRFDLIVPVFTMSKICLLYTSPSPRDGLLSRMPSSA